MTLTPNPYPLSTIFALSTPPGKSGVAVIRISGQDLQTSLQPMLRKSLQPRLASLVKLYDPSGHTIIDQALALYFPAPHSFTGEDVIELHTHGGRAVIQSVLQSLALLPGFRPAQAGEFTRRAFDSGKMDLTQIEALADLIDADTEAQRKQALRQMSGALGALYNDWRGRIIRALAHFEAYLDFPDEDIPENIFANLQQSLLQIQHEIQAHLSDNHRGEKLRQGLYVAIIGPPNAGKSSLLNLLAQRDAAIVSHIAGTTRDVIEISMDMGGYPITLADTAGIRSAGDTIEAEGIRRTLRTAEAADIKILVLDSADPASANDPQLQQWIDANTIVVWNKVDLTSAPAPLSPTHYPLSTKTGYNLDRLLVVLTEKARDIMGLGDNPGITRIRHRQALQEADTAITRFVVADLPELKAEDLRTATHAIARITGAVDVEDLLDLIFKEFCIGK